MPVPADPSPPPPPPFRTTLVRVLVVQAIALATLGLIQLLYDYRG
jgi:hypothetical protein